MHVRELLRSRIAAQPWKPGDRKTVDEQLYEYIRSLERENLSLSQRVSNYMWKESQ